MQSVTGGFGKAMGENDYAKGRLGVASPPPLCTPHWARLEIMRGDARSREAVVPSRSPGGPALENRVLTSDWYCVK